MATEEEHSCKYKAALEEMDRLHPEDFRTGQAHLAPAFREVNFKAAFAEVCRIVNKALYDVDSPYGPKSGRT